MTLVSSFCQMSSVRSTSDGRGPVTRKRVPDREEQGKPGKDARRGRCHPLEAGFWPLWMTPLPRINTPKVPKPGLGDVIFGRHSGGGHWTGVPGAWDANLAIPANTLCAGLAWDVGPASCSFLSKRESEAGSSETTHFARGPGENHPCRYSCLCVSGGTKFRDTGR